MEQLPVVTSDHNTGSRAVTILQKLVEENKWIFRRQSQDEDFGVDAEIEIVDRNLATGTLVKCQVKGGAKLSWDQDFERVRIKVSTYNNWKASQLPVVVFLVDVTTEEIFWISPSWQTPKIDAKYIYLKLHNENKTDKSLTTLKTYIEEWKKLFSFENCFNEIELISQFYEEVNNQIDGGYKGILLEKDHEGKLYLFYKHTLLLRSQTSLPIQDIITYEQWLIRNAGMWKCDGIYYDTAQQMLKYIKPYYDEAIEKAKSILEESDDTLLNQNARFFLIEDNVYGYHEDTANPEFHKEFEIKLSSRGVQSFKFADRKK